MTRPEAEQFERDMMALIESDALPVFLQSETDDAEVSFMDDMIAMGVKCWMHHGQVVYAV